MQALIQMGLIFSIVLTDVTFSRPFFDWGDSSLSYMLILVVFFVFIRYDERTRSIARKREEWSIPFSVDILTERINLVETVNSYIFPYIAPNVSHNIIFSPNSRKIPGEYSYDTWFTIKRTNVRKRIHSFYFVEWNRPATRWHRFCPINYENRDPKQRASSQLGTGRRVGETIRFWPNELIFLSLSLISVSCLKFFFCGVINLDHLLYSFLIPLSNSSRLHYPPWLLDTWCKES